MTPAQNRLIKRLKSLLENYTDVHIRYGVKWYVTWKHEASPHATRVRSMSLDGRVCNALVAKGILKPLADYEYALVEDHNNVNRETGN